MMLINALSLEDIEAYLVIGTSPAAAAGRISYRLGLQGPAVSVDTACCSSLVAVHQACQALRRRVRPALAGGVNLLVSPASTINFSQGTHALARRPVQDFRRRGGRLRARGGLRSHVAEAVS